ncbi:hypothetical protein BDZ89DRAFT_1109140 [Hymenopellis radicata]|nr:hypothetical protein BDZ89DRAFT_1109140 [Hymenopellis radicata]
MTHSSPSVPHVGRTFAIVVFVSMLIAFVVESEMTQYVQTTLGYRKPFFLFYVVHSSFAIIFPLHLLYLKATTSYSTRSLMRGLAIAISDHMRPSTSPPSSNPRFPYIRFACFILILTTICNTPGLLWFASITLASVSDVTAIWNTNAFFAYLITVKVFHLQWESRKLLAVTLATLGVLIVVYAGSTSAPTSDTSPETSKVLTVPGPTAPLVGDVLTLAASLIYAMYQVMYKKYAALPSDPELVSEGLYEPLAEADDEIESDDSRTKDISAAQPPPFGFHPNFLTSAIGVCTCLVLWIFIPILHYLELETFAMPNRQATVLGIAAIAFSGVIFNSGFMILLAMWGPIITSVGGLLTIVLVCIADILWGAGVKAITTGSVLGSTTIVIAFGMLAYDMFRAR